MGEELPRSGVYGSRGRVAPLPPRALLILFAFCLILSAPPSPSRLLFKTAHPSDGRRWCVCPTPPVPHNESTYEWADAADERSTQLEPCGTYHNLPVYAFGATKSATAPGGGVQVCFCAPLQCKNARPEITPNLSGTGLKFNISLSSIDPCPPFRAKRTDKAGNNLRLKTGRRFSRAEPPSRAPGPG